MIGGIYFSDVITCFLRWPTRIVTRIWRCPAGAGVHGRSQTLVATPPAHRGADMKDMQRAVTPY